MILILQVTNVSSCPRLVTPSNPYTLHMNVSEQLVISGSNFIEVHSYHGWEILNVTMNCDIITVECLCSVMSILRVHAFFINV